jgi:hypothetical protein
MQIAAADNAIRFDMAADRRTDEQALRKRQDPTFREGVRRVVDDLRMVCHLGLQSDDVAEFSKRDTETCF